MSRHLSASAAVREAADELMRRWTQQEIGGGAAADALALRCLNDLDRIADDLERAEALRARAAAMAAEMAAEFGLPAVVSTDRGVMDASWLVRAADLEARRVRPAPAWKATLGARVRALLGG